ncbi:hypothetical protein [Soonwooa sp.]|uniref:hypothetical protein n=1 Tax=Soonwooa sp. TaxID=1938592 RepID=UPI00262466E5|nr:hypothetical protein [Soonwooa sp.]
MKVNLRYFGLIIFLVFSNLFIINSCSDRAETVSCFPKVQINISVNTNLPLYHPVTVQGGWIYVNEVGAGTNGLIITNTSGGFKVFDRNAPHICPDGDKTILYVKDNTTIVCPKDGAEWMLNGSPTSNNTQSKGLPPKTYPFNYDPSTGVISVYY